MAKGDRGISFLVCSLCCGVFSSNAQPPVGISAKGVPIQLPAPVADPFNANPALLNSQSNAPLKEIQPGIFQLGDVKIDKRQRTVSFTAVMNLRQGAMEYFLVTSWGKVHESILRTDTEPYRIHIAMLLLGAKGAGTNEEEAVEMPAPFISNPSNIRLPGDDITLEIKWNVNGKDKHKRAEELVFNTKTKSVLGKKSWVYNGSLLEGHSFLAQREGSIVSLVTDPEALINNTGPGRDNDTIWTTRTNNLPPQDVPIEVIIKLSSQKQKNKK